MNLYNLIANSFDAIEPYFDHKDNREFVIEVFRDSASFVRFFEKDLTINKDYSREEFDDLIREALRSVKDGSFREYIYSNVLEETEKRFRGKKNLSYKAIVSSLFREIADYHNTIIEKNFVKVWFEKDNKRNNFNLPQTFLSYAYKDKGVTLGLFLYFLFNGGLLYVNWMWSGVNEHSGITKNELDKALDQSSQFLFLRTPNSDLDYQGGNHTIRQWCSWEIGNYYTKEKDKKYYIDFYGRSKKNDLLFTFKTFHKVSDGIIY